jgi:hypothetical protein
MEERRPLRKEPTMKRILRIGKGVKARRTTLLLDNSFFNC